MGMTPAVFAKIKKHILVGFDSILELGCQQLLVSNSIADLDEELQGYHDGDYTKALYESLGFFYESVDVCGGTIFCDFNNQPLELSREYDVVTNLGTSEHIFNQYNVFSSIHRATKRNGLMIHCLPLKHSPHGLFTYNVDFFISLCASNNYEVAEISFAWMNGCGEYIFDEIEAVSLCSHHEQYAFLVARKVNDFNFIPPQQIIYNPSVSIWDALALCSNKIGLLNRVFHYPFTDDALKHIKMFDAASEKHPNVILYGVGNLGVAILKFSKNKTAIKLAIDKSPVFMSGVDVVSPSLVKTVEFPVYIASDFYREEIRRGLIESFGENLEFLN